MKAFLSSLFAAVSLAAVSHAQDAAKPAEETAKPAQESASEAKPAASGEVAKIKLGVQPAVMKFDQPTLTVKAGQKVLLLFQNQKCPLQHNFLLLKPGKLNEIGALADKMLADPKALAKNYVPDSPNVIAHSTKLIGLGQNDLIEFTAPTEPGDYPYVCTFPGHWRLMNGVLKVTP